MATSNLRRLALSMTYELAKRRVGALPRFGNLKGALPLEGGRGGVAVSSDGTVWAARRGRPSRDLSTCRTQLSTGELRMLTEAVALAQRAPWPPTFAPDGDSGCCDRMTWTLRLAHRDADGRAQTSETRWFDGNESRLPKELATIRDIAWRAVAPALASCK